MALCLVPEETLTHSQLSTSSIILYQLTTIYYNPMRKLGVEEWLVLAVMSMYSGAKTVVRTVYGNSNGFEVKVGMHQVLCYL